MEHHVDPFTLPPDRLVNLAYYLQIKGRDQKAIDEFDRSLDQAARRTSLALAVGRTEVRTMDRRAMPPPSWWQGEEHAAMVSANLYRRLSGSNLSGVQTRGG